MYASGRGLRPETVEAVDYLVGNDPNCELEPEAIVVIAETCGACPDAVLLLARLLMSDNWNHYVSFSERYDFGPMIVWSREAARAVLATGLPIDGVEFKIAGGTTLSPDDLYLIGYSGLDVDLPEISDANDVLGSLEDQRIQEKAEQPVPQTLKQAA